MSMLSVSAAQAAIMAHVAPLDAERVAVEHAVGRVLAETIRAARALPGFDNSAMDGYAVRAAEATDGARLPVVAELAAGAVGEADLPPGAAMRIFTGAPLPPGADTVVMQENTRREGDTVIFTQAAQLGRNVRRAGSDVAADAVVVAPGRVLQAGDVALLGSLGRSRVAVVRAPTVAILSSGDELIEVDAGAPCRGQVVASNAVALGAACAALGAIPRVLPIVPDDAAATRAAFERASRADVIISAGGMSVGDHDHVIGTLEALCGADFGFWKVAVKPGKPLAFGRIGACRAFGLPGNPVSAQVTFELFVRPAILGLLGHDRVLRRPREAILEAPLSAGRGREEYRRARVRRGADGRLYACPLTNQSSGALSSIGGIDGLLPVRIGAPACATGAAVPVILLGPDHPLDRLPFGAGA